MTATASQRHRVRQHRQVSKVRFFRSDFSERRKTVRKSKNKPKNSPNADYSTTILRSSAESPGLRKTWMQITAQISDGTTGNIASDTRSERQTANAFGGCFCLMTGQFGKAPKLVVGRKLRNSKTPKPEIFAANAAKSSVNQQQACSVPEFSVIIH